MPTKTKETADMVPENTYPDEYKPLYVPTKLIKHNHLNPRTEADFADDEELRQSVAIRGVETAIHVRPIEPDEEGHIYEVYDGDRRLYAAEKTKLAKIPLIIKKVTDDEVIEFGMVSTIRRGLTDVEKGKALIELIKRFPFKYGTGKGKRKTTQRDLALHLGTSVNTINRYLKAATDMDPEVQALVAPEDTRTRTTPPGTLDGRTAYEIAKIDDKERQREVAHTLIDSGLKGLKAPLCRSVERFGVFVHRGKEFLSILIGTMQLKRNSPYHVHILDTIEDKGFECMEKVKGGQVRSPLPAIAGSLRPEWQ